MVYVTAELSGRTPAEVIADVNADQDYEGEPRLAGRNGTFSCPAADWGGPCPTESGAVDR